METTPVEQREFRLPLDIPMSERRIMATKFGVNWDSVEVELSEVPRPEDPDNPTTAEKIAIAKAFTRIIGPNERFAALYIAVKRQIPSATPADVERHADRGEWTLALGDDPEEESAPLAPPPPPNETTSSAIS